MTCNRKLTHAVRVETVTGGAQIILFKESAAAQGFTNIVNDGSDGRAEVIGLAHELPVIAPGGSGDESADQVRKTLYLNFKRMAPRNAELIEIRQMAFCQDDDGGYWSGLALWAHGPHARIVSEESVRVDDRSQEDADFRARVGA